MNNIRRPAEVFPPGEFLKDELEERGWSQGEFAEILGRPNKLVNEIIAGKVMVTPKTATEISAALGTSAEYWLNLESAYQLSKVEPAPDRISREARLRERFPVKEMAKRGWLQVSPNIDVTEARLLAFFGMASVSDGMSLSSAFRKNPKKELTNLQWAWIFRVRQVASALQVAAYSEGKLRSGVSKLELLLTEPEEIRHVPKILAECGVRLVVVEPVSGSDIQGVCFWINGESSPVIGLTMKYDRIDNFWFNLRHEIEHVLRGDGKDGPVVDENPYDLDSADDRAAENAANAAAADFCVPKKLMDSFVLRHDPIFTEVALIGFSRIARRHPGIVAGQIHHRTSRYELFKKHAAKVRSIIVETAVTDGFGKLCPVEI